MPKRKVHRDLIRAVLGSDPISFARQKRDEGLTYQAIARELYLVTDGKVDVSFSTIRNWLADLVPGMKQWLVTIPGDATVDSPGEDIQVLVREWESGPIEADFRSPAQQSETWCPVELLGGTVERA